MGVCAETLCLCDAVLVDDAQDAKGVVLGRVGGKVESVEGFEPAMVSISAFLVGAGNELDVGMLWGCSERERRHGAEDCMGFQGGR